MRHARIGVYVQLRECPVHRMRMVCVLAPSPARLSSHPAALRPAIHTKNDKHPHTHTKEHTTENIDAQRIFLFVGSGTKVRAECGRRTKKRKKKEKKSGILFTQTDEEGQMHSDCRAAHSCYLMLPDALAGLLLAVPTAHCVRAWRLRRTL